MPTAPPAAQREAQKLLARFRRQRPLRAGSLIVTLFGDALAPRGGRISLGSLIRMAQPFGLTDRLVRTSVARLAADDWLEAQRYGRQSDYQLTETGRARFAEATRQIYGANPEEWNGRWTLVLLPGGGRDLRERARDELKWLGFGQLAAGVLAHPTRELAEVRRQLRSLKLLDKVIVMEGNVDSGAQNHHLILAAWDLAELGRRYQRFIAMFEPLSTLPAAAARGRVAEMEPQAAFIVRTLLIHEYRKVHLRDPLLPRSLLPADWAGARAYELCRALYKRVFAGAETHISVIAGTREGALPAAAGSALERFGGFG